MSNNASQSPAERAYRVDQFDVPEHALNEFLEKIRETHELLCTLPGFLQDFLLEQPIGKGMVRIVTVVEWQNTATLENAQQIVKIQREKTQFDPQDMLVRLGIQANLGVYMPISA